MSNKQLEKKQEQQNNKILIQQQQMVSSPLPPPEWLERFVKVYPDAAKEIFEDFKKVSEANRKLAFLIQWLGFIALMSIFVLTYFCIIYDRTGIAVALLGIGTASVLGIFMNRNHNKNNQDKI